MSDFDMIRELRRNDERLRQTEVRETPLQNSGAAFPSGWPNNIPFFRTDLGWWTYYDGTRWLTAHEYSISLPWFQLTTLPYTGAAPNTVLLSLLRDDYGYYYTRAAAYTRVSTTNNGSNYWGLRLLQSSTALWDFDTSADAADTNVTRDTALASAQAAASTFMTINAQSKTGAPGALTIAGVVWYRLIIP